MDPSVVDINVGETHLVQVWLDNAENLHAIECHISFEPGYVHIEDSNPDVEGGQIGEGVMPVPMQVIRNEAINDAGLIVYHVAQAPDTPAHGSGMVASFTVRALAEGGSPLKFTIVKLQDPTGQPLPESRQIDGLVIIGAGEGAPPPTVEAATATQTALPETPAAGTPAAETPATATPTPFSTPSTPSSTGGIYHTVQRGENLYRIGLHYGTTVDAIVAANGLSDENAVQAGQTLLIPVTPPAGTVAYVVQPGDTLYSIAHRFDKTVESLAALNGIDSSYTIAVGQTLIIVP
jgi:LysM repeat protein